MERLGQVNKYVCRGCHINIFTINLNNGVTPFGIKCPSCSSFDCFSSMYTLNLQRVTVTHCFYRPTKLEFQGIDPSLQRHVMQGGLLFSTLDRARPLWPDEFTSDGQAALKLLEKIYDVRN